MMKPYFAVRLAFVALLLLVLASCRRELYVFGDEFYSVTLDVDWSDYASSDPDGMTVWFYNLDDPDGKPYRTTTASVRHQDLYLPNGTFQGVVVSYSPEEYSRQQFRDMDNIEQARVEATPAFSQPKSERTPGVNVTNDDDWKVRQALYGEAAWTARQQPRPPLDSMLYVVANQPEEMGGDTIDRRPINSGSDFGDYIPYKQRDNYQSTITTQTIESIPHSLIWTLRIRVYIAGGFNSLWTNEGSITGLSDGHLLPLHLRTENPCLLSISEWQGQRTGENEGWINATITTFGLRPSTILPLAEYHPSTVIGKSRYDGRECDIQAYYSEVCDPEDVRLNLAFILRDQHTVCTYNINVGHAVLSYDDQLLLRIELGKDFFDPDDPNKPDPIVLPDVDAYGGAGFDAVVTPWEDGGTADETM